MSEASAFMSAIGVIIGNLGDPEKLVHKIDPLALRHAAMKRRHEWYHTMQKAVIDTLRHAQGAGFTDEMHLAWRDICNRIRTLTAEARSPEPKADR